MTFLRKHRGWLMIVITVLALPFCLYFVKTDYSRMRSDKVATLYGHGYTMVELQRNVRLYSLAQALGMDTLTQTLGGGAATAGADQNAAVEAFVFNLIILQHESERLGIDATNAEKADFIRNLRGLRGPNGYDPEKYREFAENILPANGFSDAEIEELALYALSLNRVKDLVTVGVSIPDAESKADYDERYGKLFVHAIHIHGSDFAKDVKVTDDDLKKYYDAHKNEFKTEEKRKIDFVALTLTDEQKKLQGKERIDNLQKQADRANDVSQALAEKGATFEQVATKFQLPVKTTGEFTSAAPDPQLKSDPQLSAVAFQLSRQEPTSDVIQTPDGFYILHLAELTESKPLSFDEAREKVTEDVKNSRMREMAMNKGRNAAQDLRETLKSGAPLKFALEKANVKEDVIPPFTLNDVFDPAATNAMKDKPKDFTAIANAAAQTQPGEVSDFFPWEDGGLIVYVEKREPPDPAKYQQERAAFDDRILKNKRQIVFTEWLHDREREAGLFAAESETQGAQPPRGAAPGRPPGPPAPGAPPPQKKSS